MQVYKKDISKRVDMMSKYIALQKFGVITLMLIIVILLVNNISTLHLFFIVLFIFLIIYLIRKANYLLNYHVVNSISLMNDSTLHIKTKKKIYEIKMKDIHLIEDGYHNIILNVDIKNRNIEFYFPKKLELKKNINDSYFFELFTKCRIKKTSRDMIKKFI
ncbi:hypothetical protein SAMN05446037_101385 [Anaerovirgula multivorans]|uniref:Uncharacterized protein n=2 Tax=Anaerovirgula multivorans TaxID=312168 RepID=A0A239FPG3_9FIRM|nr:hypothetical protein SAMN05446037_101385 [Anaerovirgula multivorans]